MTEGATIGEASANGAVCIEVTYSIALIWALALQASELALEELPAATDGAERVAVDDEDGRVPSHNIAARGTDFVLQRFGYSSLGRVRRLRAICQLGPCCTRPDTSCKNYSPQSYVHFAFLPEKVARIKLHSKSHKRSRLKLLIGAAPNSLIPLNDAQRENRSLPSVLRLRLIQGTSQSDRRSI